jgi:hypothetical protein
LVSYFKWLIFHSNKILYLGAWGCFDEFNRLEERMLSAVSQQIQTIQEALRELTHSDNKSIYLTPYSPSSYLSLFKAH